MPASGKYLTEPVPSTKMPAGIPYIVGNEAAERFSFYGMKAILYVFMTEHLGYHERPAAADGRHDSHDLDAQLRQGGLFLPRPGAIVSDVFLGKYRTILLLSLVYCAGHAVLALADVPQWTNLRRS